MPLVVPHEHLSLPGHFPGRPVVPGVLVLECVLDAIEQQAGPLRGGLRLSQVKFLRPLLPGQVARLVLDGAAPRWRFRVEHDDALLASGEMVAQYAP